MAISYNFYKLEILGVHMNGMEIGVTNLHSGLMNSKGPVITRTLMMERSG